MARGSAHDGAKSVLHKVERDVTTKVEAAPITRQRSKVPVLSCLRDLERLVRSKCDRRRTVQIIASGRSLLGDRIVLGPSDVPLANDIWLSGAATKT